VEAHARRHDYYVSTVGNLSNQDIRTSREPREALLAALAAEVRRHQNAQDIFDDVACEWLGINRTDARCLDIVDLHGRISAGELARESGLSTGAITTVLDRLERAGFVRRVRDPEDRRRVLVEVTEELRRRAEVVWGPIAAGAEAAFDGYSDADLELILTFLRLGREFLATHTERVRNLPPFAEAGGATAPAEPGGATAPAEPAGASRPHPG
jgi:DNA-binding MarR family transcriptional regulator